MTNFVTGWKTPAPKPPPRKYLNAAGSPLTLCSFHARGQWLLTFADGTTRITTIRPTVGMTKIHNATVAKTARQSGPKPVDIAPPNTWD